MGKFDGIMIVSDCDGTLLNSVREVSEGNLAAIRYFQEQGGRFVIATGRPKNGARHIVEKLPPTSPSVFFNGALIYDTITDKVIYADTLEVNTGELLESILCKYFDVGVEAFTAEEAFAVQDHPVTRYHFEILREEFCLVSPKAVPETGILKFFVTGETARILEVRDHLLQEFPGKLNVVPSGKNFLEVFSPKSSKGAALAALRRAFPQMQTFCTVGDSYNDIPMLETADRAFIPDNGVDEAKRFGQTVRSCDEDAIADVIGILDKEQ